MKKKMMNHGGLATMDKGGNKGACGKQMNSSKIDMVGTRPVKKLAAGGAAKVRKGMATQSGKIIDKVKKMK